jgi:hypothetical protein
MYHTHKITAYKSLLRARLLTLGCRQPAPSFIFTTHNGFALPLPLSANRIMRRCSARLVLRAPLLDPMRGCFRRLK